jgi:hypothetical protein
MYPNVPAWKVGHTTGTATRRVMELSHAGGSFHRGDRAIYRDDGGLMERGQGTFSLPYIHLVIA